MIETDFRKPPLAGTCWNTGPDYTDTDHGKDWSASAVRSCAHNLFHGAQALTLHSSIQPE